MLYYATEYRFSSLGPWPASCSKEQDLSLCSWAWLPFICPDRVAKLDSKKEAAVESNKEKQLWNGRKK